MSHCDPEALAALAADPTDVSPADAAHLAACARCGAELDAFRRVVDLARADADPVVWTDPPPQVWARIEQDLAADAAAPVASLDAARAARARRGRSARPDPSPRPAWWALGAAAAGIALGLGGGALLWLDPAPEATLLASASLQTLDTARPLGDADLVRRAEAVSLAVGLEPVDAGEGYLEVWLINRDGRRMVSVGVLEPGASDAEFPVSQRLLDEGYVIVDVSREGFDESPEHSGDSVVRGTLPL